MSYLKLSGESIDADLGQSELSSSAWAGDLNGRAKQCSSESAARGKRKGQSKRPSTKRGIMQIPSIKIVNSGETYFINRATDSIYVEKKDNIMETTQSGGEENIPIHQEESWTVPAKKRKVTPLASARKIDTFEKKQWLQDIKLHNPFSALPEEVATDPTESPTNRIPKPPPIYIDAKIIDALIELLNNTAGKDNYVIKQIKIDQVKVQTNTPDTFRKVTR